MITKINRAIELNVDWSLLPNFIPIIFPIVKNSLLGLGYQRNFEILCKRYGLENNDIYTLQEIGSFWGISRERVRQLEQKSVEVIKNVLYGYEKRVNIPYSLTAEVREISTVVMTMGPLFTEDELIEKIINRYHYNPQKAEGGILKIV